VGNGSPDTVNYIYEKLAGLSFQSDTVNINNRQNVLLRGLYSKPAFSRIWDEVQLTAGRAIQETVLTAADDQSHSFREVAETVSPTSSTRDELGGGLLPSLTPIP